MTSGTTQRASDQNDTPEPAAAPVVEGTKLEGLQYKVFKDRYALKGEDGTPLEEYPEQMWQRVAGGIAGVEPTPKKRAEWTEKFYELLRDFKFVPGGRILSGAGTPHLVTYYNCYVVGLGEDPLNPDAPKKPMLDPAVARPAFFTALSQMTDIMSRSGGVGINLSALPPKGTAVAAAGRGTRGAARPTVALSIGHPDIQRFLSERDSPSLASVDLAVIVSPAFDQALADDADWTPQLETWRGETINARALWARVNEDEGRRIAILRPGAATLTVADSREAIVDGAAQTSMALFHGDSPVVDFSLLRPKGAYIKTVNGTSSGPVAWMYLFDAVARSDDGASPDEKGVIWFGEIASVITGKTIQQGGSRRGALMLMLDDDHPDIEEFIAAKRIDPITNRPVMIEHANMSLCVSDAFMAAVKQDLPWDLKWQGKVVRTVRARDIWDRITEAAWRTAEPGVVFMQRAREQSPMWYKENIRCTNPCVTGDTLVYTASGLYPAAELAEMGSNIVVTSAGSGDVTFEQATHVWASGVKPVYRLATREGYSLRLTADHQVMTTRGWVEAQALTPGDQIRLLNGEGGFGSTGSERLGQVLGWLVGDGHITNRGKEQSALVLSFWGKDREQAHAYAQSVNHLVAAAEGVQRHAVGVIDVPDRNESRVRSVRLARMIDPALLENKTQVPPSVFRGSREMQRGFLQALFSADGTVNISGHASAPTISIRLASSYRDLLVQAQQLLLNFGIAGRIYKRREAGAKALPDGKGGVASYATTAQYELILGKGNVTAFVSKIGFLQGSKQRKAEDALRQYPTERRQETFTATFESLTPDGEEMVYDLTEPVHHSFIANGLYVSNCGEQAIPAGAVCNLGAINLVAFVDDEGKLNEDELSVAAAHATRFLDDVIDATPYFSELHVKMQREGTRRIGLGTMGLADALIKMRVAYGSAESLEAIDRIYGIIRDASYRESIDLAQEKAPCGFFDREQYLAGPFIQRLPEEIREGIRQHGVRNGVLLTQAPTGTTSLLAGVSSGVEPVFDFAIKRVDRIGEHIIYHPLYQAWLAEHPDAERPDYFVATRDLTPEQHVVVQARVQQYTDSSISKTVNGPNEHTVEQVKQLYSLAYDLGCKGVTYYRDGSRDAVLSAVSDKPKTATNKQPDQQPDQRADQQEGTAAMNGTATHTEVQAIPTATSESAPTAPQSHAQDRRYRNSMKMRPPVVQGYTRQVRAPEGKVNVTLNSDEDGVLEVFVNVGKAGSDVAALAEALGRMISIHLQIDSPLSQSARAAEIAHQLRSIGGSGSIGFGMDRVRSLPDAVARALELHLAGITNGGTTPEPDRSGATAAATADPKPTHTDSGASNGHASEVAGHTGGINTPGATARLAVTGNLCPQCGCNTLIFEEGCKKCYTCGHSEC